MKNFLEIVECESICKTRMHWVKNKGKRGLKNLRHVRMHWVISGIIQK